MNAAELDRRRQLPYPPYEPPPAVRIIDLIVIGYFILAGVVVLGYSFLTSIGVV